MVRSLRMKMILFFLAIVAVSAVGFGLIWWNIHQLSKEINSFQTEYFPQLKKTYQLSGNILKKVSCVQRYLSDSNDEQLVRFKELEEEGQQIEQELMDAAKDNADKSLVQEMKGLDEAYYGMVMTTLVPLVEAGRGDAAKAFAAESVHPAADKLLEKVGAYQMREDEHITELFSEIEQEAGVARKEAVFFALGAAVLGILIGVFAAENISRPIKAISVSAQRVAEGDLTEGVAIARNDEIGVLAAAFNHMIHELKTLVTKVIEESQQVAASSEELTAGAEQSAQAAGQVAESVAEMARSSQLQTEETMSVSGVIQELSGSAQEVSANTQRVAQRAHETSLQADDGIKLVDSAVRQIERIRSKVADSSQIVTRLGDRSREVDIIVETISGIADQTNLLALNAAIEAARAGEQGRGFSVVAEEVRKLAEQSQEATKRIAEIIALIQGETRTAVESMREGTEEVQAGTVAVQNAGQAFHAIASLVAHVSEDVNEISSAVEQIANRNQEVVCAIMKIDSLGRCVSGESQTISAATEEQLATMEEISSSSQTLARMAEDLRAAVSRFSV